MCFACRKQFKRRMLSDVQPGGQQKPARCPQCGAHTVDLGLDFKPPPRRDVAAWRRIADLYTIGVTFHSCGCGGPGYRPRDPVAYRAFLVDKRREYAANMEAWRGRSEHPAHLSAVAEWAGRVRAVETAMRKQGMPPPTE